MPELKGTAGDDKLKADMSFTQWYIYGYEGNDLLKGDFLSQNYIWGGTGNDSLVAGAEHDFLYGEDGDDTLDAWIGSGASLYGDNGRDALIGSLDEASYLDGGAGADTMKGGGGGDTYVVDDAQDVISETWTKTYDNEADPIDTVRAQASYALGSESRIERMEAFDLNGSDAINLTGNDFSQTIIGNRGANRLDGSGGDDTLIGGAGDDVISGGNGTDVAVYSGRASDYLVGLSGPNGEVQVLDLRTNTSDGIDTLTSVEFLQFSDVRIDAPRNLEPTDFILNGARLTENSSAGTSVGSFAAMDPEGRSVSFSLLNDAGGLFSLSGNTLVATRPIDYEMMKSATVTVQASDGVNLVKKDFEIAILDQNEKPSAAVLNNSFVSKTAKIGQVIGSLSASDGEGAALSYKILGDYNKWVKLVGDKIVVAKSLAKAGDTVKINVAVSDGVNTTSGIIKIDLVDQKIIQGNDAANKLVGGAASEFIAGKGGNDTLYGGLGADRLNGGLGSDTFVYKKVAESGPLKASQDVISDFSLIDGDRIDLSGIDANAKKAGNQAFIFIESKTFSKVAGELRAEKVGSQTYVYGDIDGDGKADFGITIADTSGLNAGCFIL